MNRMGIIKQWCGLSNEENVVDKEIMVGSPKRKLVKSKHPKRDAYAACSAVNLE